ncbi:hypothetical protein L204_100971 [Cryptococcus depauperatus]|nr:multisite-specific tRNA:(cytosine-C5)-methyltransferase [Cryptococcus depauperatus CBS 7855]
MGRPRGKKHGGRGGARQSSGRDNGEGEWKTFNKDDVKNLAFEQYYKAQGIMTPEEWPQFMESMKTELPLTFRVTGSRAHAETINDMIKTIYVPNMQNVEFEGKTYAPPLQLPWYPNQLGWQVSAPKRVVRKTEPFKKFQRFLVGETEVGNLSRQEAVSMIPPLFLDIEPHHHCLDMCAAPGSKTAQIIEALNPHHTSSTGLLIANDSDYKRTHMLVHQTGRMPSKGLIVTNYDASMFPTVKLGEKETLQFDRILADVPCSGDGTLRKNIEIWSKWGVVDGNSLHSLQLRILTRAVAMLKPGGRLVYSTCSLNPAEDESVIAATLLSHSNIVLVDVSSHLPELKRRKGMPSWQVGSQPDGKDGVINYYATYDEYKQALEEGKEKGQEEKGKGLPASLWPPVDPEKLHLEHCMRLLPHDQNTGGFFVAVLEKSSNPSVGTKRQASPTKEVESKRPRDKSPESQSVVATAEALTKGETNGHKVEGKAIQKKEKRDNTFKEDPYSYVDPEHEEVKAIVEKFKFKDTFPCENLLVRNEYGDPLRTVYLTNSIVKRIIQNNDYTRMRIVSAGVKAFTRQDSSTSKNAELTCKWRPPIDGVLELLPHIGEGVLIEGSLAELRVLLEDHYPAIEKFASPWRKEMEGRDMGAGIVKFGPDKIEDAELRLPLYLPVWKAKMSLSLMIDKREKSILSLRTFGKDICNPPPTQPDQKKFSANSVEESKEADAVKNLEGDDAEEGGKTGIALTAENIV